MSKRPITSEESNEANHKRIRMIRIKFDQYKRFTTSSDNPTERSADTKCTRISEKFRQYQEFVDRRCETIGQTSSRRSSEEFSSDTSESVKPTSMWNNLANYVAVSRTGNRKTNLLLRTLRAGGLSELPKTFETLMGTPKEKIITTPVCNGNVWFYGVDRALQLRQDYFRNVEVIHLDIGIDGAKVFTSSGLKLWPIMIAIANQKRLKPFLVGCFEGQKEPFDCTFLDQLWDELGLMQENGIQFEFGKRTVKIRLICADAPARALICSIRGHSSHDGCPLCIMKYRVWDGKVIFDNKVGPTVRTDETFLNRCHPEHHKPIFRFHHSKVEKLIGMVSQVPIEPMHAIDLGVTPEMLHPLAHITKISERILNFRKYRPSEFARDCRSLDYLSFYKATESRQILLYGCVSFLEGLVDDHVYYMWLLLHCAARLMSDRSEKAEQAEELLSEFVELYPSVYGENSVTYNIHVILHIPFFVRLYGAIDDFSAYKFENLIQDLKKMVAKANNPLQQIFNRIEERNNNLEEPNNIADFDEFTVSTNEKDSFFAMKGTGEEKFPVKVVDVFTENGVKYVKVLRCMDLKPLFKYPMGEVSYAKLSENEEIYPLSAIAWKYCRMPFRNEYALIPMLHTSFMKFQS